MPPVVTTLAGAGTTGFRDGPGATAQFCGLTDVAVDRVDNVYVSDQDNHRIRKITPEGVVSTLAGAGTEGSRDGPGATAQFSGPDGVAVDGVDNVYVADYDNERIRKITPAGVVSTLAGNGTPGFRDGAGATAQFDCPAGVAAGGDGNVYVADKGNHRIRKITPAGVVSTLAGDGTRGFRDGAGAGAQFSSPSGVAADGEGNVYVADCNNHRIRKITPAGVVSTLAGDGTRGFRDGAGAGAQFSSPSGVAADGEGNVYVADKGNDRIRKITAEGVVSTLAGDGTKGFRDGPGATAQFKTPIGIALTPQGGALLIAPHGNDRIRKIEDPSIGRSALFAAPPAFTRRLETGQRLVDDCASSLERTAAHHAAAVAETAASIVRAQAAHEQARADEHAAVAEGQAAVAAARAVLADTEAEVEAFRVKVSTDEIDALGVAEVYELLLLLGVVVGRAVLERQGVTGAVLADVTERNMATVFGMARLGDRRRLTVALRRLGNRQGFAPPAADQPGALCWCADRVGQWLRDEGLGEFSAGFASNGIDGAVLLQLGPDDLEQLGAATLGQQSQLKRKLDRLKKATYAEQLEKLAASPDRGGDGASSSSGAVPQLPIQSVLAAVLDDNADLRTRIRQLELRSDPASARAVPPQFICPILGDVMEDPVIAMDGHTYERAAIATWFARSDRSPMTNLPIPPTLIPNIAIRQTIAELEDDEDEDGDAACPSGSTSGARRSNRDSKKRKRK